MYTGLDICRVVVGTVPQIACVYTDTDGFYNLGIAPGVTVRLDVTMGGEQLPDCFHNNMLSQ